MRTADLLSWARAVRADFDRFGAGLLDLDNDPTVRLLGGADLTGRSAGPGAAAKAALDRMWSIQPNVRAVLDAVAAEEAKGGRKIDPAEVERLLTQPVVDVDPALARTGSPTRLTVADAMNLLAADFTTAADVVGRIGAAWRYGLPLLDRTRLRLAELTAELGSFPEADRATAALADADRVAASDPLQLAEALPSVTRAAGDAETAAAALRHHRDTLPARLADAAALLERIDAAVRDGAVALDETRAKIAGPSVLLDPLDAVTVLDTPPRGLRPWLDRIRRTASGDWRAAVNGLAAWHAVADGTADTAARIVTVNRAPLARRNELRGLLDGLAAKAAAAGRAEDPTLATRHGHARTLLYTAPCDLAAATAAVDAFAEALRDRGPSPEEQR